MYSRNDIYGLWNVYTHADSDIYDSLNVFSKYLVNSTELPLTILSYRFVTRIGSDLSEIVVKVSCCAIDTSFVLTESIRTGSCLSFCALDIDFSIGHLSVRVDSAILLGRSPTLVGVALTFVTPSWEIDPTVGNWGVRGKLTPTWEFCRRSGARTCRMHLTPTWENDNVIRIDPLPWELGKRDR